ncbi:MAG: hypothetical protein ABSE73_27715 [Planctomycetota bacterium]
MTLQEELNREQMALMRKRLKSGDALWRDNVTGLIYDKGKEYNPRVVELAVQRWRPEVPVVYAEGDLANLSGLNRKLAQSGADKVMAYLVGIYRQVFEALDADVVFLRKGGDEFGLTTVGAPKDRVVLAVDNATARVLPYLKERGLDSLPHTKSGMPAGTGLRFEVVQYDPAVHRNASELLDDAEKGLEELKEIDIYGR